MTTNLIGMFAALEHREIATLHMIVTHKIDRMEAIADDTALDLWRALLAKLADVKTAMECGKKVPTASDTAERLLKSLSFPLVGKQSEIDHAWIMSRYNELSKEGEYEGAIRKATLEFIESVLRGDL